MGKQDGGEIKIEYKEAQIPLLKEMHILELIGTFPTVSSVPTHIPRKFSEQFRIYANGTTYRFYMYDMTNGAWRYVTLT